MANTDDPQVPEITKKVSEARGEKEEVTRLEVYPAKVFFSGDESDIEQMTHCLRVKNKNSYFIARATLARSAYIWKMSEEDREAEREKIYTSTKYIKFYDRRSDSFYTGLLPQVKKYLRKKRIDYKIHDHRKAIPEFDLSFTKLPFNIEVRQEQVEAVKAALERGRGILACATNAGKSNIAAGIIEKVGSTQNILYMVHRISLVNQTAKVFKNMLRVPVATIGGGKKKIPSSGILVASTQTAGRLVEAKNSAFLKFLKSCKVILLDELHLNAAKTATRVAERCAAPMRFGLSGTVNEKDKTLMMHYVGLFGPVIYRISNKQLVEGGRSSKPHIRFVEFSANKIKEVGYDTAYNLGIVKCHWRNRAVVKEALRYARKDLPTLITIQRIKHGQILKEMLERETEVPVAFISGSTPQHIREKVIKEFEQGKIAILIISGIGDVGLDIPAIGAWINAASGIGWELVLQRLGRALRRKKGRNRVMVTDFVDKQNEHLLRHSLGRLKHYQEQEIATFDFVKV